MNLDINTWKPFNIGSILTMLNGKGITQEEIEENKGSFVAVQSGEENNGVMGYIDLEYCKFMNYTISEKPCLTVARSGSAGFVSYQENGCVVGDSAKILLLPDDIANKYVYMFLQTILTANRFKYTYGRKVTEEKYLNELIDLPIKFDSNGVPEIDITKRFSDDGFIPDWQFMENYIKSLNHKPITTKNTKVQVPELNIQKWKEFRVGDLFPKKRCNHFSATPESEGKIPFISSTSNNNGVATMVDEESIEGNCITVSTNGDCFDCFYQPDPIVVSNDVEVLYGEHINPYTAMFINTVLMQEKIKWSYGRKPKNDKVYDTIIKLPTDIDGNPDWQFMENYIKSLPYGDRI